MHVYTVVPVAPFEPESVITKSIECLRELECDSFNHKVYYVIDTFPGDKRKLCRTLPDNFKMILRNTNRGRRAGAINDILNEIENADYMALIDVDWRPAKDYIVKCVAALEENDSAFSSSGCSFVTNNSNVLTKIMSIENYFLCDMYRLLSRSDSFLTFKGGGVVRGRF